jgi:hypothetical protein
MYNITTKDEVVQNLFVRDDFGYISQGCNIKYEWHLHHIYKYSIDGTAQSV